MKSKSLLLLPIISLLFLAACEDDITKKTVAQLQEMSQKDNNVAAMLELASRYHRGQGVEQSYEDAREWYEQASAHDNAEASLAIAKGKIEGDLYAVDEDGAQEYIQKAVSLGSDEAKYYAWQIFTQSPQYKVEPPSNELCSYADSLYQQNYKDSYAYHFNCLVKQYAQALADSADRSSIAQKIDALYEATKNVDNNSYLYQFVDYYAVTGESDKAITLGQGLYDKGYQDLYLVRDLIKLYDKNSSKITKDNYQKIYDLVSYALFNSDKVERNEESFIEQAQSLLATLESNQLATIDADLRDKTLQQSKYLQQHMPTPRSKSRDQQGTQSMGISVNIKE